MIGEPSFYTVCPYASTSIISIRKTEEINLKKILFPISLLVSQTHNTFSLTVFCTTMEESKACYTKLILIKPVSQFDKIHPVVFVEI